MSGLVLDATDAAIVTELQHDGRISLQALADKVSLSRTAVRARVHNLLDAGVARVVGIVHSEVIGLAALAHVRISVDGAARPVAERLAQRELLTYVSLVAGRHAVTAEIRARNSAALIAELDWLRSLSGIRRLEVFRAQTAVRDAYLFGGCLEPVALDDADWMLLRELQRDGRVSYAQLAQSIGLSQAATRARMRRLIASGTVRVIALVDSAALGVREAAGLGVRVHGDALGAAERLAALPGFNYVFTGFGGVDIVCGVDAASRAQLLEVIEVARALPQVVELEAWQHLEIVKESYAADLTQAMASQ